MTHQLEAFPPEDMSSPSPRLAWLTAHDLIMRKESFPRCRVGAPQASRPWVCANKAMTTCCYADTELEATQLYAEHAGLKHWIAEELERQVQRQAPAENFD